MKDNPAWDQLKAVNVEEKNTGEASLGAGYSSANSTSLNVGLKEFDKTYNLFKTFTIKNN